MSIDDDEPKQRLIAGSCGWSTDAFAEFWFADAWAWGDFEMIDGVLARRAPIYLYNALSLTRLLFQIDNRARKQCISIDCCPSAEMILTPHRVVRADAAVFMPEDAARQEAAEKRFDDRDERRYRVLVPPTLVIESTCPGYEQHDTHVKKGFYAEFGVQNYWILDSTKETLDCFHLQDGSYVAEQFGQGKQEMHAAKPFAMTLHLSDVFESPY